MKIADQTMYHQYENGDHIMLEEERQDPSAKYNHANHVSRVVKYLVLGFSISFWILGFVFITVGYITTDETGDYLLDITVEPGVVVSFLGAVIIMISMFGVVGIIRENLFLLKVYRILLMATFVLQVFCGFLSFAFFPEVKKMTSKNIALAIKTYSENADLRDFIDTVQDDLECCGSLSLDDWDSNVYFSCKNVESYRSCGVPPSCCLSKYERNLECGNGIRNQRERMSDWIHMEGCLDKIFELFKSTMEVIAGVVVTFTVPLVANIVMIPPLMKQIMKQFHSSVPDVYL